MLWFKTFHILFVMAWMAGVFYLPRILVHYVEGKAAAEDTRRLVTMAEKLLKFSTIMAALAITLGLLLWLYYGVTGGWMHAKLFLVGLLVELPPPAAADFRSDSSILMFFLTSRHLDSVANSNLVDVSWIELSYILR